jgi:hypothetical protein
MPRSYQRRQTRPFWPTRASSSHQSWSRAPGCASAIAASLDPSPFFERGPRGRAALRVARPRLLAREPQPPEQAGHAPLAVAHAIGLFGMRADVDQPPSTHPVALGTGTAQHPGLERRLLPRRQPLRPTGAGPAIGGPGAPRRCSGPRRPAAPAAPSRRAVPPRPATGPRARWRSRAGAWRRGGPARAGPGGGARRREGPGGWRGRAWQRSFCDLPATSPFHT